MQTTIINYELNFLNTVWWKGLADLSFTDCLCLVIIKLKTSRHSTSHLWSRHNFAFIPEGKYSLLSVKYHQPGSQKSDTYIILCGCHVCHMLRYIPTFTASISISDFYHQQLNISPRLLPGKWTFIVSQLLSKIMKSKEIKCIHTKFANFKLTKSKFMGCSEFTTTRMKFEQNVFGNW